MRFFLLFLFLVFLPASRAAGPVEKDLAAYLLVYFKDSDHGLHFALSSDGYRFTDVNAGRPVFEGATLAQQKGIRDPFIMRGPDGTFYLAMTDLHIFAQKEGLRPTKWERDEKRYGWGNNRSMVLMRSADLVDWTHSDLRVDTAFPGLEEIGCAWAPQMIYDPARGAILLYFSMRFGDGKPALYSSYMNKDFTAMETKPELLFAYPDQKFGAIDGDITKVGDTYHLFYATNAEGRSGIMQATSKSLASGYKFDAAIIDPEPKSCEAPTVWKRLGEEKWVLMYDSFGLSPNNMGFAETTDFKTFTPLGHFNDGPMKATNFSRPKHGAVVHLTKAEADRLAAHWKISSY